MRQKRYCSWTKVSLAVFSVAVCVGVGGMLFGSAKAALASNKMGGDAIVPYEQNDAGQTFGSCVAAEMCGQMPDLVLVVATNGREGYVYREELEEAESLGAETPKEAIRLTTESDSKLRKQFRESLADSGYEVSDAVASAVIEEARYGSGIETAIDDCVEALLPNDAGSGRDLLSDVRVFELEDDIVQALQDGIESTGTILPVYSEDGKTVIGEFLVGGI